MNTWHFNYEGDISRSEYWRRFFRILPLVLTLGIQPFLSYLIGEQSSLMWMIWLNPFTLIIYLYIPMVVINLTARTLTQRIKSVGDSPIKIFFVTLIPLVVISISSLLLLKPGISVPVTYFFILTIMFIIILLIPLYYGVVNGRQRS